MPARHDGILLDLDGTLWNAASASAKGWNEVGNELGILSADLKKSDIENVSGHPLEKCIGMLFPESAIQKYPNLVNALEKGERKIIEEEGGEFYQGILDGIPKIARSFPLFIVSNCQQWYLDCFFKHSNLRPHFRDTDCHGKSNICKADMIRHMVLKHKLVNPIYVGDTLMDKDSSRMAQVEFGYADYGFGELGDEVLVFDSFTSLIAYFLPDRACNSDQ